MSMKFEKMLKLLLSGPAIVICGRTGSGKSVLLHYITMEALKSHHVILLDWSGEHDLPIGRVRYLSWNDIKEVLPTLIDLTLEETIGTAAIHIARKVMMAESLEKAISDTLTHTSLDRPGALAVLRRLEILREFVIEDEVKLPRSFVVDFSVLSEDARKVVVPFTTAYLYTMMQRGKLKNTVILVEEAWRTEIQKALMVLLREARKYNNKVVLVYQTPPERLDEVLQCNLVVFDLGSKSMRYLLQQTWPLEIAKVKSPPYCYAYIVHEKKWYRVKVPRPRFTLKPKTEVVSRVLETEKEVGGSTIPQAKLETRETKVDISTSKPEMERRGEHGGSRSDKIPVQVTPRVSTDKVMVIVETLSKEFKSLSSAVNELRRKVEEIKSSNRLLENLDGEMKELREEVRTLKECTNSELMMEITSKVSELSERISKLEESMVRVNELARTVNKLIDAVKALTLRLEELEGG